MQNKITESRLHAINAQMNPHFIFNCMHSVQTLINKKDFQGADNCLVRFAKLIRKVLDNSTQKEILLEDEIETLHDYVELEKLHLEYPMEFEVNMDEKLNQAEVYVPPLIIQPFVENAIIHGLKPKKANGKVFVNIKKEIDNLVIEIADNGVGRNNNNILEPTDANGKNRKSYGEPLTKERLENIGRPGKLKAGFIIDDVYDAENRKAGTKVTLTIPL